MRCLTILLRRREPMSLELISVLFGMAVGAVIGALATYAYMNRPKGGT